MITLDVSLFYFINNSLANPIFDSVMPFITELRNIWWLYIAMIIGSIFTYKKPIISFIIIVSLALTLGLTDWINSIFIKDLLSRPRPCHTLPNVHLLVPCGTGYSFPSSHAANNFAIITFLIGVRGRYIPYIAFFCTMVSLSRIFVGVHYPSDILGGGLVGTTFGFTFAYICNKILTLLPSELKTRE